MSGRRAMMTYPAGDPSLHTAVEFGSRTRLSLWFEFLSLRFFPWISWFMIFISFDGLGEGAIVDVGSVCGFFSF